MAAPNALTLSLLIKNSLTRVFAVSSLVEMIKQRL